MKYEIKRVYKNRVKESLLALLSLITDFNLK